MSPPRRDRPGAEPRVTVINIKDGMPTAAEAVARLRSALARRAPGVYKVVHGYGSSGAGGRIRIEARRALATLREARRLRAVVPGETWLTGEPDIETLLDAAPHLQREPDLVRRNPGVTIVLV